MELKDLSSNWKKLQLTLKQKNAVSEDTATNQRREQQRRPKRKQDDKVTFRSQHAQYPHTKRLKRSTEMNLSHSNKDATTPTQHPPTIRSLAQASRTSFGTDRVHEGLSPRCAAINGYLDH